ncbi:MbnP family copper-binding protein [Zhongshania sp. BJYM1]|uniref:MbnP family copper-binding protein n=1 Tax=Zhongshania aquatica TaxID=2965069 RepID=UPI0022B41E83|nr:MbnP family copper-binding protein [Marortus sp. BJYM1]
MDSYKGQYPVRELATENDNVSSIRFTVGVPSELNHEDASAASAPLNRTDLFWSWQSGYKHLRMDVAPEGGVLKPDNSTTTTWNIHLGSTGCVGSAQTGETVNCSADNRPIIELDVSDIANQQIVIDYGKLVENSSLLNDQGGAPGCMSGPTDLDCPDIFDALGMGLGENSDPTPGQTVFSVETL